jgi:hypothetical protein
MVLYQAAPCAPWQDMRRASAIAAVELRQERLTRGADGRTQRRASNAPGKQGSRWGALQQSTAPSHLSSVQAVAWAAGQAESPACPGIKDTVAEEQAPQRRASASQQPLTTTALAGCVAPAVGPSQGVGEILRRPSAHRRASVQPTHPHRGATVAHTEPSPLPAPGAHDGHAPDCAARTPAAALTVRCGAPLHL